MARKRNEENERKEGKENFVSRLRLQGIYLVHMGSIDHHGNGDHGYTSCNAPQSAWMDHGKYSKPLGDSLLPLRQSRSPAKPTLIFPHSWFLKNLTFVEASFLAIKVVL